MLKHVGAAFAAPTHVEFLYAAWSTEAPVCFYPDDGYYDVSVLFDVFCGIRRFVAVVDLFQFKNVSAAVYCEQIRVFNFFEDAKKIGYPQKLLKPPPLRVAVCGGYFQKNNMGFNVPGLKDQNKKNTSKHWVAIDQRTGS